MKRVAGEKEMAVFGTLTLTNKRIVQEYTGFWESQTNEIPLSKIDSVFSGYRRHLLLLIIGIALLVGAIFVNFYSSLLFYILLIVAIVCILLSFMKEEFVEIKAGTAKLIQSGKGAEEFADWIFDEL